MTSPEPAPPSVSDAYSAGSDDLRDGSQASDAEWLDALFAQPARDLASLPMWARPVVTPAYGEDR